MCSKWCWNMSKLYNSGTWEASINSFKRFWWCIASLMNIKLLREWIFNFKNVDFWHFSILYQIGNDKKNLGSFLEQGLRSRWWKRNYIESCPIKSNSGFSRHLVRFSELYLSQSKVKLQLKVSSEVLPPSFRQQLCPVYPIVI